MAVVNLLQNAMLRGDVDEAIDFLDEHVPGFSDLNNVSVLARVHYARAKSLNVLQVIKTDNEIENYLRAVSEYAEQFDIFIEDGPNLYINWLFFRGEEDAAIELALSRLLSRQIPMFPHWRMVFRRPQFANIIADSRVQKELQRWDKKRD